MLRVTVVLLINRHGTTVISDLSACKRATSKITEPARSLLIAVDMRSLEKMQGHQPTCLYPAHGPHIPTTTAARNKISEYVNHRQQRENQIIKLLDRQAYDDRGLTVAELVDEIYTDLPERAKLAAEKSVEAHLSKLKKEGKAKNAEDVANADKGVWTLTRA